LISSRKMIISMNLNIKIGVDRMKKRIWVAMAALMTTVSLSGMVGGNSVYAAESANEKKRF